MSEVNIPLPPELVRQNAENFNTLFPMSTSEFQCELVKERKQRASHRIYNVYKDVIERNNPILTQHVVQYNVKLLLDIRSV